jgi:hypothetical protein
MFSLEAKIEMLLRLSALRFLSACALFLGLSIVDVGCGDRIETPGDEFRVGDVFGGGRPVE